jgi:hypothetical protein
MLTFSRRSHWFGTVSIRPSRELMSQAISIFEEEVQKIQTVAGLSANFVSYTLHPNAINTMKVRGGNALGIDQDEPLIRKINNLPSFFVPSL